MKSLLLALLSLFLLASCAKQAHSDLRPELAGVYRSTRSIEGALAVGVTYQEFSTLVRELSSELLMARDSARYSVAPKVVSSTLDKYAEVLAMYADSVRVWRLEIQDNKFSEDLPVIGARYGITVDYRRTGTIDFEAIRQRIWEKAVKLHEQQIAIAYGYTPKG